MSKVVWEVHERDGYGGATGIVAIFFCRECAERYAAQTHPADGWHYYVLRDDNFRLARGACL